MQSFPKPLSAKEEKECIEKCRAGDFRARNCLIERNLRLVAYIAKKYNVGDKDMDDLISIGTWDWNIVMKQTIRLRLILQKQLKNMVLL